MLVGSCLLEEARKGLFFCIMTFPLPYDLQSSTDLSERNLARVGSNKLIPSVMISFYNDSSNLQVVPTPHAFIESSVVILIPHSQ